MPAERLRWRDVRRTTPFRLTLMLGAVFLAALWATLAFSYLLTARELTARSDRILFARAGSLLAEPASRLPARIRAEIANGTPGFSWFALIGSDGEPIVGNIRLSGRVRPGHAFTIPEQAGGHAPVRVLTERTATGETIVLGRDISQIRDLRRHLLLILLGSGLAGSAAVLAAAVALSLAPLRRVQALARASGRIAAGDLAVRMPILGRHDELDQFAGTVNRMVDEVSHVVGQVKIATDAIAHDLRTPLARTRAALHRLRQRESLPQAEVGIVADALADLDAVIERFGALLRISELEAAGRRSGLRQMALAPLLDELVELYQPLAEERGVTLALDIDVVAPFEADGELLFEAVGNLLDNAIKFARSAVLLRARQEASGPVLEVVDDGPGIPTAERGAVLRRFHRTATAAAVEGTGLGLAVVSAILRLHGFALELDDAGVAQEAGAGPGLLARVRLAPGSGVNFI